MESTLLSNRINALFRYLICPTPVAIKIWRNKLSNGRFYFFSATHKQDWICDPYCKNINPFCGEQCRKCLGGKDSEAALSRILRSCLQGPRITGKLTEECAESHIHKDKPLSYFTTRKGGQYYCTHCVDRRVNDERWLNNGLAERIEAQLRVRNIGRQNDGDSPSHGEHNA